MLEHLGQGHRIVRVALADLPGVESCVAFRLSFSLERIHAVVSWKLSVDTKWQKTCSPQRRRGRGERFPLCALRGSAVKWHTHEPAALGCGYAALGRTFATFGA